MNDHPARRNAAIFSEVSGNGDTSNPTEFLEFQNVHQNTRKGSIVSVQIDYVDDRSGLPAMAARVARGYS